MRDHSSIVAAAGSDEQVAARNGVSIHTVRSWKRRNRIAVEHWSTFVDDGVTSLEELVSMLRKDAA